MAGRAENPRADGEKPGRRGGGAKPERGGVSRLGDIQRRARVGAAGAGEVQRFPIADRARHGGAVGRAVERCWRAVGDGVVSRVVEGPIRDRQSRTRAAGLVAEPRRCRAPRRVAEARRSPRRPEARGGDEVFPGARGGHEILRIEQRAVAEADVAPLRRVGVEGARDGAVGLAQREIAAGVLKAEIRVQLRARHAPVLAGCEYHEPRIRVERHVWELPPGRRLHVVREPPAGEVHGRRAVVVQLDPVRAVAVHIVEQAVVFRHELRDDDLAARRANQRQPAPEQELEKPPGWRRRAHLTPSGGGARSTRGPRAAARQCRARGRR